MACVYWLDLLQLFDGVKCLLNLHDNGVVHRDLKPSNLLLNNNWWRAEDKVCGPLLIGH